MKKLIAVLFVATTLSASAPVPKVGDEQRKPKATIDLDTITRISFVRCKATDKPDRAICEVEVTFQAITYDPKSQDVQLPKKVLEISK